MAFVGAAARQRADRLSGRVGGPGHWALVPCPRSNRHRLSCRLHSRGRKETPMSNIFYIIGVVVVVFAILGYLGLR